MLTNRTKNTIRMKKPDNSFPFLSVLLFLPIFLIQTSHAEGKVPKNILFYMGYGTYSMRISIWPLVEALTEQGHRVTFLSAYESKNPHPGVIDFVPKKLQQWWEATNTKIDAYELRKNGMLLRVWFANLQVGIEVCEKMYEDSQVLKWIQNSKFDLIFIDSLFNDCAYGLAYMFRAKTIVLSTTTLFPWFYDAFGIPDDSSWAIADIAFSLPARELNFLQRTINAVMPVVWKLIREWWFYPKLEKITKIGLKLDSVPSFAELEKNVSLIFITSHYSQEFARAVPPNVIPIGGLALTDKQVPLPKEVQEFIDRGKEGFIFISFGTVAEFASLENELKEEFINGLLKFPHIQFIWKSIKGVGVELPKNFMVLKWAPQQSLLAHPKIKAFITHAGLGGVNEAIFFAVPMVSLPIFAEQDHNANLVEAKEIVVKLEITTLKAKQLESAIRKITENPQIKENIQKVSRLFKDRPQSALETSLWWTNFVLNNNAAEISEFLRPLSVHQPWWIRRQLDVWLFIATATLLIISIFLYILKWLVLSIVGKLFKQNCANRKGKKDKQT